MTAELKRHLEALIADRRKDLRAFARQRTLSIDPKTKDVLTRSIRDIEKEIDRASDELAKL
jgi:hypothetical protein